MRRSVLRTLDMLLADWLTDLGIKNIRDEIYQVPLSGSGVSGISDQTMRGLTYVPLSVEEASKDLVKIIKNTGRSYDTIVGGATSGVLVAHLVAKELFGSQYDPKQALGSVAVVQKMWPFGRTYLLENAIRRTPTSVRHLLFSNGLRMIRGYQGPDLSASKNVLIIDEEVHSTSTMKFIERILLEHNNDLDVEYAALVGTPYSQKLSDDVQKIPIIAGTQNFLSHNGKFPLLWPMSPRSQYHNTYLDMMENEGLHDHIKSRHDKLSYQDKLKIVAYYSRIYLQGAKILKDHQDKLASINHVKSIEEVYPQKHIEAIVCDYDGVLRTVDSGGIIGAIQFQTIIEFAKKYDIYVLSNCSKKDGEKLDAMLPTNVKVISQANKPRSTVFPSSLDLEKTLFIGDDPYADVAQAFEMGIPKENIYQVRPLHDQRWSKIEYIMTKILEKYT